MIDPIRVIAYTDSILNIVPIFNIISNISQFAYKQYLLCQKIDGTCNPVDHGLKEDLQVYILSKSTLTLLTGMFPFFGGMILFLSELIDACLDRSLLLRSIENRDWEAFKRCFALRAWSFESLERPLYMLANYDQHELFHQTMQVQTFNEQQMNKLLTSIATIPEYKSFEKFLGLKDNWSIKSTLEAMMSASASNKMKLLKYLQTHLLESGLWKDSDINLLCKLLKNSLLNNEIGLIQPLIDLLPATSCFKDIRPIIESFACPIISQSKEKYILETDQISSLTNKCSSCSIEELDNYLNFIESTISNMSYFIESINKKINPIEEDDCDFLLSDNESPTLNIEEIDLQTALETQNNHLENFKNIHLQTVRSLLKKVKIDTKEFRKEFINLISKYSCASDFVYTLLLERFSDDEALSSEEVYKLIFPEGGIVISNLEFFEFILKNLSKNLKKKEWERFYGSCRLYHNICEDFLIKTEKNSENRTDSFSILIKYMPSDLKDSFDSKQ